MKRVWKQLALLLALLSLLALAIGCDSESKPGDFVIENGVLTAYTGRAKDVVIPDGVTEIGANVFESSKIKTVVIPDSVKVVGYRAFYNCHDLVSVKLPDNGIILKSSSFDFDYKLEDMVIPDSAELRSHAITHNNAAHFITPAPQQFSPGGQINYLSGITLCNMQFTAPGELRLTFFQDAGKLIPVSFSADGGVYVDYKIGFSVRLRMTDGSEISMDHSQIEFDSENNDYRYCLYFLTDEKPFEILVDGTKETVVLNGKTYAPYAAWEQ